jgi:hypothetical protein
VAADYAKFSGTSQETVTTSIQQSITSSVTDRVATNKSVGRELVKRGVVNPEFIQLFCNVHPLDTLSSKSREALKKFKVASRSKGW